MITALAFKTRYTEFSSLSDTFVNALIAEAVLLMDATTWGDLYDLGQMRLVAHLAQTSNSSNEYTRKTIGSLEVEKGTGDGLNDTAYYREYSKLLKRVTGGVAIC